jgi:signal transduction histidine kinase
MATSYVLVTAAVVILLEAVAIGFVIPNLLASQDLTNRVNQTAANLADQVALVSTSSDHVALPANYSLGQLDVSLGPGQMQASGNGVEVPQVSGAYPADAPPFTLALLFSPDGQIIASSYPSRYPPGSSAYAVMPNGSGSELGKTSQISSSGSGRVAWAVQPVVLDRLGTGLPPGASKAFPPSALVYVQAPLQAATIASVNGAAPLLQGGLVLLVLTLPVGLIFGVLTTQGLVRRLRRLGSTTAKLADGDLSQRVTPGNADEVGHLERDFNHMAERLQAAVSQERALAEKSARLAERSRISRELHDSISQDLFSLSLLANGLDKALPDESPVRKEVRALAETVQSANREMRALLLELRPTTLEEKGLVPALHELVSTYADRLGINVDADLETVPMAPAAELAALRIAQEGLANAVKHAQAKTIRLSLHRNGSGAELCVTDDGRGFDQPANGTAAGLGLRLMRERVEELGGTLAIRSATGEGTVLTATLP